LKLHITIDGKTYEADVEVVDEEEDESPLPPGYTPYRPAPFAGGADGNQAKECRSPVTGLVIEVNVKPGQAVEAGELMVLLEAMKMETNVTAPRAATVKRVHVAPGDPVKLNQVMVEFE
jgi:methylmalonyl-CoA carboxyltransferase small subunit